MISIQKLFKRDSLNNQGARLSKIARKQLLDSGECYLDFSGVPHISPQFFQDFIYPLVLEFGSHDLNNKLFFRNMQDAHLTSFKASTDLVSDYMDELVSHDTNSFDEIYDITFELLIKARELSKNDLSLSQIIFGINEGMAESFANMDIELIHRISNAGILCFEPRLTPEFASKMAALDASELDVFLNVIEGMEGIYET